MAIANVVETTEALPQTACGRLRERFLLVAAAVLLVWDLGSLPLRVNAEIRCADVVRGMLDTGDWVMPRLDGQERPHKPPLTYWLSTACCEAAGEFGYAAFRLPSALAAIGIVLLVLSWGRRLGDPCVGILAAALLSVDYLFLSQGRRGTFEMPLAFFCVASLDACARLAAKPSAWRAATAAGLFALAFLAKGTPALLFVPLPLLAWRIGAGKSRELLRPRAIAFVTLALLLGLSWHLYVCATDAEARRTILGQFLLPFVVLSCLPEKQDHYLLPALAPLALLSARAALWAAEGASHAARALLVAPSYLAGVLLVVGGVGGAWAMSVVAGWRPLDAIAVGAGIGLLGVASFVCVRRRDWPRVAMTAFTAILVGWWCYFSQLRPVVDGFASRAIYRDPSFDEAAWRERLHDHPFLRSALHVREGDLR